MVFVIILVHVVSKPLTMWDTDFRSINALYAWKDVSKTITLLAVRVQAIAQLFLTYLIQ